MKKFELKAKVGYIDESQIDFEFGRTQASMDISGSGSAARKLKLKEGDKVTVTITKK